MTTQQDNTHSDITTLDAWTELYAARNMLDVLVRAFRSGDGADPDMLAYETQASKVRTTIDAAMGDLEEWNSARKGGAS